MLTVYLLLQQAVFQKNIDSCHLHVLDHVSNNATCSKLAQHRNINPTKPYDGHLTTTAPSCTTWSAMQGTAGTLATNAANMLQK
jgi:hypothetical protein